MRTLDHNLTQGSSQWGCSSVTPTCRQLPTHLQIQGLFQGLGWTARRQQCGEDVGPPPHLKVCN